MPQLVELDARRQKLREAFRALQPLQNVKNGTTYFTLAGGPEIKLPNATCEGLIVAGASARTPRASAACNAILTAVARAHASACARLAVTATLSSQNETVLKLFAGVFWASCTQACVLCASASSSSQGVQLSPLSIARSHHVGDSHFVSACLIPWTESSSAVKSAAARH